jgi:hypothetical protein
MTMTLLVLNVNPALEEEMVDYLLVQESVGGFTSYHVYGHGQNRGLSVAEQVTGRQRRQQYEILIDVAEVSGVLDGLADSVGPGIVYWQQAVSGVGHT